MGSSLRKPPCEKSSASKIPCKRNDCREEPSYVLYLATVILDLNSAAVRGLGPKGGLPRRRGTVILRSLVSVVSGEVTSEVATVKPFWLLVFVSVSFNSLGSQEVKQAPTVEQCRAEQRQWLSELEEPILPPRTGGAADDINYQELDGWAQEMFVCHNVDPPLDGDYFNTAGEIAALEVRRLRNFLLRHNLWDQFLAEDAQGKR